MTDVKEILSGIGICVISLILIIFIVKGIDKGFENRYCTKKKFVLQNPEMCPEQYKKIKEKIKEKDK